MTRCVNHTQPRRRTSDHGRSTLVDGVIEICDDDGQYSMYK